MFKNHFSMVVLLSFLLAAVACKQSHSDKTIDDITAIPTTIPSLNMEQTADGKWVILDGQKEVVYEVFISDNGPDYEADGLFRVVKNGKIGYADAKTYSIVIGPLFDCAYPFENGKAKVSNQCKTVKDGEYSVWENDIWQYMDKQGKFQNKS